MSSPSTKTLDHIVHLTPPGTVDEVSRQFRELGFHVTPGGTHAGGRTSNALVILKDGTYLELISFTPPDHHHQTLDKHPWADKSPGWIDFAFLGSSSVSISSTINVRAQRDASGVRYLAEVEGGRVREGDGKAIKWVISAPDEKEVGPARGMLPFFCGDVTPRALRVPIDPPSNAEHPSRVLGIAHVRLLAHRASLSSLSAQVTCVIGDPPQTSSTETLQHTWLLETPTPSSASGRRILAALRKPIVILSAPENEEEEAYLAERGAGVYEVAFWVGEGGRVGESRTPYGKIVWVQA